ncbi:putative primase/helicase [Pseudomonas phage PIP]|nr:putative primase/helicase [Pseudomonas phage PIP]
MPGHAGKCASSGSAAGPVIVSKRLGLYLERRCRSSVPRYIGLMLTVRRIKPAQGSDCMIYALTHGRVCQLDSSTFGGGVSPVQTRLRYQVI